MYKTMYLWRPKNEEKNDFTVVTFDADLKQLLLHG